MTWDTSAMGICAQEGWITAAVASFERRTEKGEMEGIRLGLYRWAGLWRRRKGIGALQILVAFLACAGDRRVAVWGSAITGARKGRSDGKERKGTEAVLTCGAGLQREGEATRVGS